MELGLREALLKDGRALLQSFLQEQAHASAALPAVVPAVGEKRFANRPRHIATLFGSVEICRDYFYSAAEHAGRAPFDEALALTNGASPGLVRLVSRAAARQPYQSASDDLLALAGITCEARQIQRLVGQSGPKMAAKLQAEGPTPEPAESADPIPIMYVEIDATGIPMVAAELENRRGKQPDGSAKTREVKLGAIFTQTKLDKDGQPVRDPDSTTYLGTMDRSEDFGPVIRREALRRGLACARKVVVIGDGAAWIWELARIHFPNAICILDFYHMMLYLHAIAKQLYGAETPWMERKKSEWKTQMKNDQVADVIASMRTRFEELAELPVETQAAIEKNLAYLENHRGQMRYGTFRKEGYFYGSGVVEAGCRTVVGQRLKQSGMFWAQPGAENVLSLRCALLSHRWDECWDQINRPRPFSHSLAA